MIGVKFFSDGSYAIDHAYEPNEYNKDYELFEELPTVEKIEGKNHVLRKDKNNNLYWEYVDRPKTYEEILKEKIAQLEAENANINYALMIGGLI